jgi:hypothetical protein
MTKYKICKFVNGNGREWYQIRKKGYFFWHYLFSYKYMGPLDFPPLKTVLKFDSFDEAEKYVKMTKDTDEYVRKNRTVKKVECFDYE